MLRSNNAARVGQKRTIRPLYAWHSAVPYACFLDVTQGAVAGTLAIGPAEAVYPGQVAVKTTGEQMRLAINAASTPAFGLFNNFIGGVMDELGGGTEIGVWVGGRDSVFEVLAGPSAAETPFSSGFGAAALAANATVGGIAVFSDANGRLSQTAGSGLRVARLIEAVSASKVILQLDLATA